MSQAGKMPNWEVTGKYDTLDERPKRVTESFCMHFLAKGKSDAIAQAKKYFDEMAKELPEGDYKNFRNIKATPLKD